MAEGRQTSGTKLTKAQTTLHLGETETKDPGIISSIGEETRLEIKQVESGLGLLKAYASVLTAGKRLCHRRASENPELLLLHTEQRSTCHGQG